MIMATPISYWILVSGGDAWQSSDAREIAEFRAQGFNVVARVSPEPVSPLAEVDANVAWCALGEPDIPEGASWGVPVWLAREWIKSALRKGDYEAASAFSVLIPRASRRLVKV